MPQYDLNLRDYWRILRKRVWSVAAVTVAFGALALLFAEVQKPDPLYQATAVVKFERITTLANLLVDSMSLSQGDSMSTQAAVVRSFPVLERAAKILRLIPSALDSDAIKQNPMHVQLLTDLRGQIAATPEGVVGKAKSGTAQKVHLQSGDNTLVITVTSPDGSVKNAYTLVVTRVQA